MNKFLFDPLTGVPTISATNRSQRTDQTGAVRTIQADSKDDKNTPEPTTEKKDFFAKGNEHLTPPTLYQDADDWTVRVFSNKFPLLDDHEVIVHSPDPVKDIEDFDVSQVVSIIRAYLNRVQHYNIQEKEVIIFNNKGGKAGASLLHPHSQLVASKGFPGTIEKEKEKALHYYNEHNSCYWCDEIAQELEYKERIVVESQHFVVYVPSPCRWSYEMQLSPKLHRPNMLHIDETEIHDLANVLQKALQAYAKLFGGPDRNFWIHTMRYEPYHWHIGFIAHIKVFGALELGAGIWVNDKATPEDAAKQLREALKN